jgi:uncharacterized protein DUF6263
MKRLAAGFLWVALGGLAPQDGVALEWKLSKGDVLRYRVTQDSKQTFEGLGQPMEGVAKLGLVLRFEVTEVADGVASIRARYEAARVELKRPARETIAFDSSKPGAMQNLADPYSIMLAGVLGQEFGFKADRRGKISDTSGGNEIVERMLAVLGNHPNKNPTRDALLENFGDAAISRTLTLLFGVVPNKTADGKGVKVGDQWGNEIDWPLASLGKVVFDRKMTLRNFEIVKGDGCAKVDITTKATLQVDPKSPGAAQFEVQTKEAGGSGEMIFSLAKKRVRSVSSRQTLAVHCVPKLPETAPVKIPAVDQRLEMSTSLVLLEDGEGL